MSLKETVNSLIAWFNLDGVESLDIVFWRMGVVVLGAMLLMVAIRLLDGTSHRLGTYTPTQVQDCPDNVCPIKDHK